MKEIKLKQKTLERINQIEFSVKNLNEQKNSILLTILEDAEIDLNKFKVDYNNGVIVLTDSKE